MQVLPQSASITFKKISALHFRRLFRSVYNASASGSAILNLVLRLVDIQVDNKRYFIFRSSDVHNSVNVSIGLLDSLDLKSVRVTHTRGEAY